MIRPGRIVAPAGALLLAAVLLSCGGDPGEGDRAAGSDVGGAAPPGPGDPAPSYRAVTLGGDPVRLAGLEGEVVLLNVWATWCVPCRQEIPELQALHEAHSGRGLRVVGISVDGRAVTDQVRAFVDELGMTYDVWLDPDHGALTAFGATGVPLTVLIDRGGRIAWRRLGPLHRDDPELLAAVDSLLTPT